MHKEDILSNSKKDEWIVRDDVSFVTTVYNEEDSMPTFLKSLMYQKTLPAEIVIVDGGSVDRTLNVTIDFFKNKIRGIEGTIVSARMVKDDALNSCSDGNLVFSSEIFFRRSKDISSYDNKEEVKIYVKIIEKKGANISQGRNIAIRNTKNEIICVSDAGCILERNWIEEITKSCSSNSCSAAGGFNCPVCTSFLERCLAMCIMPEKKEIKRSKFMPSSRNISFKKDVWISTGGYPENMDYGEDMKFNFNIKDKGFVIKFNPDAVVYWKMRKDMLQVFRQFFRYAKGDAKGRMYLHRHLIRFASFVFLFAVLAAAFGLNKWFLAVLVPLFAGYVFKPYRRLQFIWGMPCGVKAKKIGRLLSIIFVPFLLFYIDLAKFFGYIYGLAKMKK